MEEGTMITTHGTTSMANMTHGTMRTTIMTHGTTSMVAIMIRKALETMILGESMVMITTKTRTPGTNMKEMIGITTIPLLVNTTLGIMMNTIPILGMDIKEAKTQKDR
jgi:hypothetical protein